MGTVLSFPSPCFPEIGNGGRSFRSRPPVSPHHLWIFAHKGGPHTEGETDEDLYEYLVTDIAYADEFNITVDELLNVQLNFVDMKQMGIDIPEDMEEQDPYAEWREMRYQRDEYFDALIEAVDSGGVFDIAKHPVLANLLSRKSIPKDLNKVVALYKQLTPEGQKKVLSYASDLSENPKYRRDNDGNAET